MTNKFLLFLSFILVPLCSGFGQSVVVHEQNDSIPGEKVHILVDSVSLQLSDSAHIAIAQPDSIAGDSIKSEKKKSSSQIDSRIEYSSTDSIVFYGTGTGFLYNQGDVKYKDVTLKADYIRVQMDSSLLYARGVTDSIGDVTGEPIFGDKGSEYNSKEIRYNLNSGKGFVTRAVTQQGEGYIVSEQTKKTADDMLAVANVKYSTCDDHDHPHFYLNLKKGKVKPNKFIVSGPAQLYIADVPLPLIIPFGFFPFTNQYSSGLLMPTFTDELTRGFGLVNGGYYFAFSDYFDMELKGDIYTKGSWAVGATSTYLKRYRFRGNFNVSYRTDITGEKDMPDYTKNKSFNFQWSHSQDAKANPYATLSASVNLSSSGYDRNNVNGYINPYQSTTGTKASSINFSKRFPNIPSLSINGNASVSQSVRDSTLSITLPTISIAYSRFFPFKRKNAIGKERWYEKIYLSYSGSLQNSISNVKEYDLFNTKLSRDWRNGMKHSIPIAASFNVFNYITVTPSISYEEQWHTRSIRQHYDANAETVVTDTISGFGRSYNFSGNISAQTKLYGYYIPLRSLFGDKVDRFRHVITPKVSMSYSPDFGDPMWGFYDSYIRTNINSEKQDTVYYSIYANSLYSGPGRGKSGKLNFSLDNNLEMKLRNDNDTTGKEPFKIVSLIDNLSLSWGYDFMKDSLNWDNIGVSLRVKILGQPLNISGYLNPYLQGLSEDGNRLVTLDKLAWKHGRFPAFSGTSITRDITINNDTFKNLKKRLSGEKVSNNKNFDQQAEGDEDDPFGDGEQGQQATTNKKKEKLSIDNEGYEEVKIPWSFGVSYTIYCQRSSSVEDYMPDKMRTKMKLSHNLSFNGRISLTSNWSISGTASYDFNAKKIAYTNFNVTRNLHCWTMTATIVPFGYTKSYNFRIGVNASMLQELKWEKRSNSYSASRINWY